MDHTEFMSLDEKDTSKQHESSSDEGHDEPLSSLPEEEAQEAITIEGDLTSHMDQNPTSEAETERMRGSKAYHENYEKFLAELGKLPEANTKLQFVLDFMESSLSQTGTPHFRTFWDARSLSLSLFKEDLNPSLRSLLWAKYEDLSKEARRLKEILDEQSLFAIEQFEIAIVALENEIVSFDEHLDRVPSVSFDLPSDILSKGLEYYEGLQRQLNLLNAQASRINALRKELIRTEMRVRQKNKFFQRLSAAGDKVFPRRKDLIKEVSHSFHSDVDAFIASHFVDDQFHDSLFSLREEIKMLQGMAKLLTLNTHAFNHTRMELSACWDKIKEVEKERKKERAQQKVVYKQNVEEGMQLLEEFKASYEGQEISSTEDSLKRFEEVVSHLRRMDLGREEEFFLKGEVQSMRKLLKEKLHREEIGLQQQSLERDKQRRQKILELKQQLEELCKTAESMHLDLLISEREKVILQSDELQLNKAEQQEFDRLLKPLRDLIAEMKENSLLTLSDDDRQSLQQLKEVLKQKRERRQEIKEQMGQLRKASGGSGLDFQQAMLMNEQVATEKERLEKINQSIQEIETKISTLSRSR